MMFGTTGVVAQLAQSSDGGGPPGWFVAVFVLMLVLGIGGALAKMSWVRDMARRRGLDPDDASKAAFFGGDLGVAATYLKDGERSAEPAVPSARPAAERLAELEELRGRGLITQAEFDRRRAEIIDSI